MYGRCGRKNARPGPAPGPGRTARCRRTRGTGWTCRSRTGRSPPPNGPAATPARHAPAASCPFGSAIVTSCRRTVPSGESTRSKSWPAAARAATMAPWNVVRRSTMARQLASEAYASTNHDSAPCTWPNAPTVCIMPPSSHRAGEIARRGDHDREDHRHLVVADGQRVQQLHPPHDRAPVADHRAEPVQQQPLLLMLAAVQRDALHVLAHPHQGCSGNPPPPAAGGNSARPAGGRPDG